MIENPIKQEIERLVVILGDQLDIDARPLESFNKERDCIWMCECLDESTRVWNSRQRITLFLSAMRHFRNALRERGFPVRYHRLEENPHASLAQALESDLRFLRPRQVVMVEPGEFGVSQSLEEVIKKSGVAVSIEPDTHFLTSRNDFNHWAGGRKQLRLENFYRHLRQERGILLDQSGKPEGGIWNYDKENRKNFGKTGPIDVPEWPAFKPDTITREVISLVEDRFYDHPGSSTLFEWPVNRKQALTALSRFTEDRLPGFGMYQDAMWTDEPHLYHSGLSVALNLKLLNPREVVDAALEAYESGHAPLASVEGFVRQVIGWREFIRGIYWRYMPEYLDMNALHAHQELPGFYWNAETDMECLRQALTQTLKLGYAHHIQRLMVTGLYALLLGVIPRQVHEWYLAVYVDAVEWVEAPNTLGMSQFADGGIFASKPYAASGNYINRMSNYCVGCRYDPGMATGQQACPFNTLYWDFLQRHRTRFESHPRTALQWRNLSRKSDEELRKIRMQADSIRNSDR